MQHLDNDVHVIGHETPGKQAIALAVKMEQRILDKRGDVRLSQPTFTESNIQIALDAVDCILSMQQRLRHGRRQAIGKSERHELDRLGRIEVR
jgi:hypothetical protein